MDKLLSISNAAKILGVTDETLRNWHKDNKLVPVKTHGGHRRYLESDINKLLGIKTVPDEIQEFINNRVVIYGRVSSHDQKQKGDLDRQCQRLSEYCAKKHYSVENILKDVGSGLSDTRTGLNKLFDLVINQKIKKVIIENNDRLTRFQFNVFVRFFDSYGVVIECVDRGDKTDDQDLVDDIMLLMASFSGKLYGRRSAKRRKELKQNEDSKINKV